MIKGSWSANGVTYPRPLSLLVRSSRLISATIMAAACARMEASRAGGSTTMARPATESPHLDSTESKRAGSEVPRRSDRRLPRAAPGAPLRGRRAARAPPGARSEGSLATSTRRESRGASFTRGTSSCRNACSTGARVRWPDAHARPAPARRRQRVVRRLRTAWRREADEVAGHLTFGASQNVGNPCCS